MVAYTYNPPGGFPGDITRHDFTTTAEVVAATNPPTLTGQAVAVDGTGAVRAIGAGDTNALVVGVTVRSFPMQMASAPGAYGQTPLGGPQTLPSPPQPVDVLRRGGIRVQVVGTPVKNGTAYVWIAATAAPHVQGGFEAAAGGANTIALDGTTGAVKATFNGPAGANGTAELYFNI